MEHHPNRQRIVTFEPSGRRFSVPANSTLLEAARLAGRPIASICGGQGTCGKCRLRARGGLTPPSAAELERLTLEELQAGIRLACQARVLGPVTVEVPAAAPIVYKAGVEMAGLVPALQPNVFKSFLRLSPPSLADQRSDLERLRAALGAPLEVDMHLVRSLPALLRKAAWEVTAVRVGGRLAALEPGDTTERCYGVALDLGTTTVAGYLLDLSSGRQLAAAAATNRQTAYGDDVISRLDQAHAGRMGELQRAAQETLNDLVAELCRESDIPPEHIYEAVLVGNTCMVHLLLGIDPYPIGVAPYVPAVAGPLDLLAGAAGLALAPGAGLHILPAVSGYVGADAVADALAAALDEPGPPRLLLDLGTNAEMILSAGGKVWACAAAAGPAFEGARISCGMRAAPGAIDRVAIVDGRVQVHTLEEEPPLGLAGSGLVSAAAALRRQGLLSARGRFETVAGPGLFAAGKNGPEFLLVPATESGTGRPIALSQKDIAELLLAKAAIVAGMEVLLQEAGLQVEDLSQVLVAGSFGSYVDRQEAMEIGLVPPLPPEAVRSVGNAAGTGAVLALLSRDMRKRAEGLARRIRYIELSARADFSARFVRGMAFP